MPGSEEETAIHSRVRTVQELLADIEEFDAAIHPHSMSHVDADRVREFHDLLQRARQSGVWADDLLVPGQWADGTVVVEGEDRQRKSDPLDPRMLAAKLEQLRHRLLKDALGESP